ncbi:MAG TPA: hypothetical protein VIK69_10730 [Methylophilaceae bacterium]|jgi:hypothetical protein
MATKIITAKQQMRAAQTFTFFSILAVLLMPTIIPMLFWIAASIFVYAAAAHHPNPRVCEFLRYSGYRFYGVVGSLVVLLNFSPQLSKAMGGWIPLALVIWAACILVVVPFGIRDLIRARKEPWQDIEIESDEH